jgi:hypothetical protein
LAAGLLHGILGRMRQNFSLLHTNKKKTRDPESLEIFQRTHTCMDLTNPESGLRLRTTHVLSLADADDGSSLFSPVLHETYEKFENQPMTVLGVPLESDMPFLGEVLEVIVSNYEGLFPEEFGEVLFPAEFSLTTGHEFDPEEAQRWEPLDLWVMIEQALSCLNGSAFECNVLQADASKIDLLLFVDATCDDLFRYEDANTLACFWARIELSK